MLKINNKQNYLLFILLTVFLITGCEEEGDEDAIIGTWKTSSFETYENLDCTGSLESKNMPFDYKESYEFSEDRFIWSTSLNNGSNSTVEEGSYTLVDSVYTLSGEGSGHGKRRGKLIDESSMFILLQWDDEDDLFYLLDTCYKLTFDKK
jgi:hypothetical protein